MFELTPEEQAVINHPDSCKVISIAGSGKTTSLILRAKSKPGPVLILCFGKRNKEEIERIASQLNVHNIKAETVHSLAYSHVVSGKKLKIVGDLPSGELITFLNLTQDFPNQNQCFVIAAQVKQILNFYNNSTFFHINKIPPQCFENSITEETFYRHYEQLLDYSDRVFEAIQDGELPLTHDAYLKIFWLDHRELPYEYIYFDEGQDATPVMVDIVMRQGGEKVFIGDEHQQIYSFRHAIDTMSQLELPELKLSSSFRFGEQIAKAATCILTKKSALGLTFQHSVVNGAYTESTQRPNGYGAVIARTGMGLLRTAIKLINADHSLAKSLFFEGDLKTYQISDSGISIYDLYNLFEGNRGLIRDAILKSMHSFDDIKHFARTTGDHSLATLIELVETYKKELIPLLKEFQKRAVNNKSAATLIFTTAHKSKGLEYDEVILDSDFKGIEEVSEMYQSGAPGRLRAIEELNLQYVSITRSKGYALIPEFLL